MTIHRIACIGAVLAAACLAGTGPRAGAADGTNETGSLEEFLARKRIDRAGRGSIEEATAWDDAVQQAVVRVLLRLPAPRDLQARWRAEAVPLDGGPPAVGDRLVAVRGRATFVGQRPLTPEQQELAAGRQHFDVVRIEDTGGLVADVLVLEAPRAWPRGQAIDEPATAYGLPLSTTVDPRPADVAAWPEARPAIVLAAAGIGWTPATPLGGLGMDYALFDTLVDGRRLEPRESDAFFAMLAAVARMPETPPGEPTDIVPLIDPAQKWFATHRGEEVVIRGVARRATRIAIDEPARQAEVGADHYWELYVFVPTPPLVVDGNPQDSFPVVCCVREVAAGMPTGDQISESVDVPGFAFKRYAYPLPDADIGDEVRKGMRRETALVLGRRAVWRPAPSTRGVSDVLFAVFASFAAIVAGALAWGVLSMRRAARQSERESRARLPEKITLPGDGD